MLRIIFYRLTLPNRMFLNRFSDVVKVRSLAWYDRSTFGGQFLPIVIIRDPIRWGFNPIGTHSSCPFVQAINALF